MSKDIERRALAGLEIREAADGKPAVLRGYAAVFGKRSLDLGGFTEVVSKGAFSRSLSEGAEILAFAHHDSSRPLARKTAGTLEIREDEQGLLVEITLADTTHARDILQDIKAKNVEGMSFGFRTRKDRWTQEENKSVLRELMDVELIEVSPVTVPAYPDTSIAQRHFQQAAGSSVSTEILQRVNALRLRLAAILIP